MNLHEKFLTQKENRIIPRSRKDLLPAINVEIVMIKEYINIIIDDGGFGSIEYQAICKYQIWLNRQYSHINSKPPTAMIGHVPYR